MKVNKNKIIFTLIFLTIVAGCLVYYIWKQENRTNILEAHIFSLKSGNSTFIRTPNDKRYIINGGANAEIIRHITKVLPFYSRKIEGIFVTDTDPKNIGGLIYVLERYNVDTVYFPAETVYTLGLSEKTDDAYSVFVHLVQQKEELGLLKQRFLSAGDTVTLDVQSGTKADILFPVKNGKFSKTDEDVPIFEYSKASAPQLVMKINSILFLGDATKKIQKVLEVDRSDVLVATNSANNDQLDGNFLAKVSPRYLVYSKQENSNKNKKSSDKEENINFARFLDKYLSNVKEGTVRIRCLSDDTCLL